MLIKYYNLSQCEGDRLVYFRSTDIEQHNYHRLLWSVPDEWLYLLHKNHDIMVIDNSSNNDQGKVERIFIPILNGYLNFLYHEEHSDRKDLRNHFRYLVDALKQDKQLVTKFDFWKTKIANKVNIQAKTIRVSKELNPLYDGKEVI
jgi:hypothetical protein